jgi:hypothetical protein
VAHVTYLDLLLQFSFTESEVAQLDKLIREHQALFNSIPEVSSTFPCVSHIN